MQNIVVSDIFGKTEALEEFASTFTTPAEIVDPYNGQFMQFQNEQAAYTHFSKQVTLAKYSDYLYERIQNATTAINLIGFSVGASVIWKISGRQRLECVVGARGYYSSQIRHFLHVHPHFPINLIFPISEQHFSVEEVMLALEDRDNVTIRQLPYLHGFMNTHSTNFNAVGYKTELSLLSKMQFKIT